MHCSAPGVVSIATHGENAPFTGGKGLRTWVIVAIVILISCASCSKKLDKQVRRCGEYSYSGNPFIRVLYTECDGRNNAIVLIDRSRVSVPSSSHSGAATTYHLANGRDVSIDAETSTDYVQVEEKQYPLVRGRVIMVRIEDTKTVAQQVAVQLGEGRPQDIVETLAVENSDVRRFIEGARRRGNQ